MREPQLRLPEPVAAAYAATATAHARLLITLNEQIADLKGQAKVHFLEHPDAEIYLSMPGIAEITGARVLAEFGDDPARYADAKARKSYAGTSPITRASGKSHTVQARHVRTNRLADALQTQAFSALRASPGARHYYDKQRAREIGYDPALRQLGNRLVGILHGCLKTRTLYDEATACSHHAHPPCRLTPNDMGCLTRTAKRAVPAPGVLGRDFTASAPGMTRVGAITYIPTDEGWLYPP
ncbi:transposase [Streptomyces sp. NPDC007901]|uniref:transposase n=1 Tax=Streptomyces sp. NPDC007901 TaxID=3364785 RepID=UPI0036EF7A5A